MRVQWGSILDLGIVGLTHESYLPSFRDALFGCGMAKEKVSEKYQLQCAELEVAIGLGEYYNHRAVRFFLSHDIPPVKPISDDDRFFRLTPGNPERDLERAKACKESMRGALAKPLEGLLCRLKQVFDAQGCVP